MLSDIQYDASLSAMRAKLYGLRGGSLDLFVDRSDTYVLSSKGKTLNACEKLGDTGWRAFPREWLSPKSQCVGIAPLGKTDLQWWKIPVKPAPSTYWIWFKSSDQTPFRLAFQSPSDEFGLLSRYALSYQIRFDLNPDFQLFEISRACQGAKRIGSPANPGISPGGFGLSRDGIADLA